MISSPTPRQRGRRCRARARTPIRGASASPGRSICSRGSTASTPRASRPRSRWSSTRSVTVHARREPRARDDRRDRPRRPPRDVRAGHRRGRNVRARGRPQAAFVTSADHPHRRHVGVPLAWAPAQAWRRVQRAATSRGPGERSAAGAAPVIDAAGHVSLTAADWDKVEQLLGGFATAAGPSLLVELVEHARLGARQRSPDARRRSCGWPSSSSIRRRSW